LLLLGIALDRFVLSHDLEKWIDERIRQPEPKWAPAVALELLEEKSPPKDGKPPAINGWRKQGADLPEVLSNASDKEEHIPGRFSAHGVTVHPMPKEFVAVAWKSPIAGAVRVTVRVAHAHPDCGNGGNGVAWWLEQRRAGRATPLGQGVLDLGQEARPPATTLKIEKGDQVVLAVDARDGNHVCDLTEIGFTITEDGKPGKTWDLAADIADTILEGNPHADRHGNGAVWSFVCGPSKGPAVGEGPLR
jgi:hypothetical protein